MVADQAAANLAVAKAQLLKDQASLAYATTTYERDVGLLARGIVSQATLDTEKSAYEQAAAQIAYDQPSIQEREAELRAAQVNLGYSRIISPVNGIVVSRNIEVGQTTLVSTCIFVRSAAIRNRMGVWKLAATERVGHRRRQGRRPGRLHRAGLPGSRVRGRRAPAPTAHRQAARRVGAARLRARDADAADGPSGDRAHRAGARPSRYPRRRSTAARASAAIGVATAQLYPTIPLSASVALETVVTSGSFSGPIIASNLAAGLTAPLFHGGTLLAQRRAAIDAYAAQLGAYRQTVLLAFGQVADVLQALQHDAELLGAENTAVMTSEASLKLAQDAYAAGRGSLLQVLDAQRLYGQALLGYAHAKGQRYLDTILLFEAMGGTWRDWIASVRR